MHHIRRHMTPLLLMLRSNWSLGLGSVLGSLQHKAICMTFAINRHRMGKYMGPKLTPYLSSVFSLVLASIDDSCLKHTLLWSLPNSDFLNSIIPSTLIDWLSASKKLFPFPPGICFFLLSVWIHVFLFYYMGYNLWILLFLLIHCPRFGQQSPFLSRLECALDLFQSFFNPLFMFSCNKKFQAYLVLCQLQPWNQPLLQGVLAHFLEDGL